jgi:hypothetical protein
MYLYKWQMGDKDWWRLSDLQSTQKSFSLDWKVDAVESEIRKCIMNNGDCFYYRKEWKKRSPEGFENYNYSNDW